MRSRSERFSIVVAGFLAVVAWHAAGAAEPFSSPEHGTVIEAPGARLYVEVRGAGDGIPLLVVNGGPGFDHDYLHISDAWDLLAAERSVVFYDQRGNGRSPALAEGQSCTLADQIEDLEAVRAYVGAEKIDLLGHSWGGYLVMAYAARHPEHIAHLVICDSAAPKWPDTRYVFDDLYPETWEKWKGLDFADALGDQEASDAIMRHYMSMLFVSPEMRDLFLAHASEYHYTRRVNETLDADLARFDLNPELPKFDFPTLVLTGRFDANVAPSTAWKIHKEIPGSKFVAFEKSGHFPFLEERDAFVRTVDDFLRRSDDDGGASFSQLFAGSPCGDYGTVGCTEQPTQPMCNPDWTTYFTTTENSITMTAGDDCRTVNTHDRCLFTVGDRGITQIRFDFTVADSCHGAEGTEWLAFWMYRKPWQKTVEVDFIESKYGPGPGLSTNLAGSGHQVVTFDPETSPWTGSIEATFSGTGDAVEVKVGNSHDSEVATATLAADDGYFFVLDTATGANVADCTITISNLEAKGTVASETIPGNCAGLIRSIP